MLSIFSILFAFHISVFAENLEDLSRFDQQLQTAKTRCAPAKSTDPAIYQSDFRWNYDLDAMAARYTEIYQSGKRLAKRAYFNPEANQFFLQYSEIDGTDSPVPLTDSFLKSVMQQIEQALQLEYAQFIFFPDLGHAHLFVPQKFYDEEVRDIGNLQRGLRYKKMLNHTGTKLLYHTAEQLHMRDFETKQFVDNDFIRWRYFTRNLVGYVNFPTTLEIHKRLTGPYNTVRSYPNHKYWSAGFDISASKDGCFPFKTKNGEIHYFDLSLYSLEPGPTKKKRQYNEKR